MGESTAAARNAPWWLTDPGRWAAEKAALRAAGATVRRLPGTSNPTTGVLQVSVGWPEVGRRLRLRVTFPPEYPWFPPEVTTDDTSIRRHHNPKSGALCLLADPDAMWHPGTLLADLLTAQLPRLLAANELPLVDAAALEHHEAEGARTFVGTGQPVSLLVDPDHSSPPTQTTSGWVHVGLHGPCDNLMIAVGRIADESGMCVAGQDWGPPFGQHQWLPWLRLDRALTSADTPARLWDHARTALPDMARKDGIVLLRFRDEIGYRTDGWAWLALCGGTATTWILAEPAGPRTWAARIPDYTHLARAHIVLIGTGSLGATIATALACAGLGELTLVDGDRVRAATICRQTPLSTTGLPKTAAVAHACYDHHPGIVIHELRAQIGAVGQTHDLAATIPASDLVIDAAANPALSRWLATTSERDTDLITAAGTWGAWGGSIVTYPTRGGGCWACLELHRADHTLPWPPASPEPAAIDGCSAPTFPGAHHDLADLAHHAVRVAATRLTGDTATWADVNTLTLRTPDGQRIPPTWSADDLPVHPACRRPHRDSLLTPVRSA